MEKEMKVIPFSMIGNFVTSELVIKDNYRMIIDFRPPYKTLEEWRKENKENDIK